MQGDADPLSSGSHLNPLTQSRGYVGGGQIPAVPAGPRVTPNDTWKIGSNSPAKSIVWKLIEGVGPLGGTV
jgi:hypothetical protein